MEEGLVLRYAAAVSELLSMKRFQEERTVEKPLSGTSAGAG